MTLDWNAIIVALIAAVSVGVPSSIIAWKTHRAVNSRMSEMLEIARTLATLREKEAERERQATKHHD